MLGFGRHSRSDRPSERIAVAKRVTRESCVDDRHLRATELIRIVEITTEANACIHRIEVPGSHDLDIGDRVLAIVRATVNCVAGVRPQRVKRNSHHSSGVTHTWHRADLCEQVAVEAGCLARSKRARCGIRRRGHEDSLGREPEIDLAQTHERP